MRYELSKNSRAGSRDFPHGAIIRELKQTRRRRKRERDLKM